LKEFYSSWDEKFVNYFQNCIYEDALQSFRPNLEKVGLYVTSSGITNNAAESVNSAFKKIVDKRSCGFFQAVYCWYFYQVDSCIDITNGIEANSAGDFRLSAKPVPKKIYIPKNVSDVIDPNTISSVVFDGRLPPNLSTSKPYKSKSVPLITSLPGLADMFIEKGRVTWLPKESVFVVIGLGKIPHTVSFWSNFFKHL